MSVTTGSVRVVFWNTWLLRPRLWPGGPALPFTDRLFAPDVTRRAPLVGRALAGWRTGLLAASTVLTEDLLPRLRRFSPGLDEADLADIVAALGSAPPPPRP